MSIWNHRAKQTAEEAASGHVPVLPRHGKCVDAGEVRAFGGVVEPTGQPQG